MNPKTDKIDIKNDVEKKTLLKIILEPSWGVLGSSWVPSWGRRMGFRLGETAFRENQQIGANKVSRGDLVPNLGQLGRPKGSKREPLREPKRCKKRKEN